MKERDGIYLKVTIDKTGRYFIHIHETYMWYIQSRLMMELQKLDSKNDVNYIKERNKHVGKIYLKRIVTTKMVNEIKNCRNKHVRK